MAGTLEAELRKPHELTDLNILQNYDLIGFGSGIYFGKFHASLLKLVEKLPPVNKKKAFIFHTSGFKGGGFYLNRYSRNLKRKLSNKGFEVIAEFSCRGWDTFGPFKIIGGLAKGRPSEKDLEQAKLFAEKLKHEE